MRTPEERGGLTFEFNQADNEERLRELILYVVEKCGSDPRFGATKLNKVLYYSDFYSYAKFGKPVTGVAYQKLKNGPAPKRLLPVRDQMEQSGDLEIYEKQLFFGKRQTRFIARRDPDMSLFNGEEIALVNEIIDGLRDKTADVVSEESHGVAWQLVEMGELIPYEYVFLVDKGITDSDRAWAHEVAAKRRAAR